MIYHVTVIVVFNIIHFLLCVFKCKVIICIYFSVLILLIVFVVLIAARMDGSIPRYLSWGRDADHGNSVCTGGHMPSPMRISCSAPDFHERLLCFFRSTPHAPSAKAFELFIDKTSILCNICLIYKAGTATIWLFVGAL